ncbi:SGNH/GDSL hydrolase family protein [Actinokineospora fastidiosa]|uniref:SGNH hydrolase n=1 Tax=Actinokineospora fastidiosa TaxID=1816 RepID=A0A918GTY1_9PSEU|nr:SGNH/GDSL hydrolase family protein [Actinokineospora fastidiosa]GGS60442.1 SGNH hydrolase [Actinokineospora fastidiosa]
MSVTALGITPLTWTATRLAVLGDSTGVGVGDPVAGGWRGVGALLAEALGAVEHNVAFEGARVACVRGRQLPLVLEGRPDAAIVIAGMNDTLRSDFDPVRLQEDLGHIVTRLQASGARVVLARYHDHGRVFRMPSVLKRALKKRIDQLNDVIDQVQADTKAGLLDLDAIPGAYEHAVWSVDRLHPSELGHRLLAEGFAARLAETGCAISTPVSLVCQGGRRITVAHHIAWLIVRGIPWLCRRGRDLLPLMVRAVVERRT